MTTKTATLLPEEVAHDENGETLRTITGVYRLDPPLIVRDGIADHVVASTLDTAIMTSLGTHKINETYVWISDSEGMVVDWHELPCSGKNLDHAGAFARAGYTIVTTTVGADA
ncbi:hypothetical protein [Nocardia ignorata]|uniref:Uncharacterized protein n=1 Tax=Nocardia ignorata TaxID=145285 RepID=A0A4R6NZT4_NOCIG|nr:hypothetical protein [Nocardia ignorata]TDP29827.1 hypothetical protein DFR75_11295 [Nocardia ignorata]